MASPDSKERFWETYRAYSLLLLFPALLMLVLSLMLYSGDTDSERLDRKTRGVVTSCTDVTRRSKAALDNGGPQLSFLIEADYEVEGVTYTCKESRGSRMKVGSEVTVTYNSTKPSDSTLNPDPVAGKARVGMLAIGSGIALPVILFPLVTGKGRKPKDKHAKPEG